MRKLLLTLLVLLPAAPLNAQWNLDGYLGWAAPVDADLQIGHPTANTRLFLADLPFETRSFDRPLYYGARGGVMLRSGVGLEAEWIHLKVFADVDSPIPISGRVSGEAVDTVAAPRPHVEQLSASHGLNMLLGNLVVRVPVRERFPMPPGLNLVARFGAGPTFPHVEARVLDLSADHYEAGGVGMQASGAVEALLWRSLYAVAEYKYTWARQRWTVGPAAVETTIGTHHVVAGLSYRFELD